MPAGERADKVLGMAIILAVLAAAATDAAFGNMLVAIIAGTIVYSVLILQLKRSRDSKYVIVQDMDSGRVKIMPQDAAAKRYLRSKGE